MSGKRVIIVGSSISAAEIASDMALKADHIIHIAPHKFWPIPRFTPIIPTDPASPFLPLDLNLYRRSTRILNREKLFRDVNDYRKFNEYCRLIVGSDQPFSHLSHSSDDQPTYATISEMYLGWYRAARISLQHGCLKLVNQNRTLILDKGTTIDTTSDDVFVLCTGFRPCLDFFSRDILEQLCYKPDDIFCPLILYREILPLNLPGLAFIGMFRGPYWTIIDFQARWTTAIFSGNIPMPSISEQQIGIGTQHHIRNQHPRPQFPHADPVGAADDLAKDLGLISSDITDIVLATHYQIGGPDPAVIAEYNVIVETAGQGRFVAGVVFRALHGSKWTYERTITGRPMSGVDHGQAEFDLSDHRQLLYLKEGEMTLSSLVITKEPLRIIQNYIYVYDEDKDNLTVYFAKNKTMRGSFLHTIYFEPKKSTEQAGWTAFGSHQCRYDHYSVSYLFAIAAVQLARFEITYSVFGLEKDYVTTTIYRPK